jgi:replicative DNA helicase
MPDAPPIPAPPTQGEPRGTKVVRKPSPAYSPDPHRTLPHSADAEKGVLGSALISPVEAINACVQRITPAHFFVPAHATIYELLVKFWDEKHPIDLITLTQALADGGRLAEVGGPAAVAELFSFVPTAANLDYYLDILREKYILRTIITACTEAAGRAYETGEDVDTLLDEVEQKVFAITSARTTGQLPAIKDLVFEAVRNIEALFERRGAASGLTTGFADFDAMTDGLHESEMIVIAARPSMGKTALAMNIAEHVAVDLHKPVAVFSLEMSAQQLVQRLICSRARVSLKKIKDGFVPMTDFPKLTGAATAFADSGFYIDDTSGLSILELRAKARRLKAQHDIQLIVIDYLQLLRSDSRRAKDNRQLEIAEISYGIKALAKELRLPIIVLAQLNRKPEERKGGRPMLSDLRESGSIEQDADVVGLLVRSEYYAEDRDDAEPGKSAGEAELIIAKQRNGPVGDVPLTFVKEFTRFESRARSNQPD